MSNTPRTPGVVGNRLDASTYERNFGDACPPLDAAEARAASERCLNCADAPCVAACPTGIDVPGFLRRIAETNALEAGREILERNILGGMCARVCPVETLCEGACAGVMGGAVPVEIGRLQRHATDAVMAMHDHPFRRAAPTGLRIAVVGAGPAGLACAHRLAANGHGVTLFDARDKPGGLNEYGIAAYKVPGGFAQAEIGWLMGIGGIALRTGVRLGRDLALSDLREDHDAVFLGLGLAGVNALRADSEGQAHVEDAVDFIARLRQADDPADVPVGRSVVVIGGGMTAVDAAVQARLLGSEQVTIVYRRGEAEMAASEPERLHAVSKGVRVITGAVPLRILGDGRAEAVEFAHADPDPTGMRPGGETFRIAADQVLKAMGQKLESAPGGLRLEGQKIAITAEGRTSLDGVWAGGDCATGGSDLTVVAVAQGRDAADDMHRNLTGQPPVTGG